MPLYFVTEAELQQNIDLKYIARNGSNVIMGENEVTIESKKSKSIATLNKSGKLVSYGGNTKKQARKIARSFAWKVKLLGHPGVKFKIQRFRVSTCDQSSNFIVNYINNSNEK